MYHEALSLGIGTVADEAAALLAGVTSVDEVVALIQPVEIFEAWNVFEELSSMLSNNAFLVLSGELHDVTDLQPHFLNSASVDIVSSPS